MNHHDLLTTKNEDTIILDKKVGFTKVECLLVLYCANVSTLAGF